MSIKKFDKLKTLLKNWLPGTVTTTDVLLKQGFTYSDIQKYLSSKWIESLGHGAYKKFGDNVNWQGAIYGLQNKVHIGGKTALNLKGMVHYLNIGKPQIYLFSNNYLPLPLWFRNNDWQANIKYLKAKFLPEIAIDDFDLGNFIIKVSSPERAALELMYFLERIYGFEECKLLAENFNLFRPDVMQELLEQCSSIKAKRLILYFANSMQMKWYEKLNLEKINLGKGYRKFIENGIYDEKYKITIPKEFKDEKLEF